jgi:hypothetical protein
MRDRTEQILRVLYLVLVALVAFEILRAGYRANPFARLRFPAVPTLQTNSVTNVVASGDHHATNSVSPGKGTNVGAANVSGSTNGPGNGTNGSVAISGTKGMASTNLIVGSTNIIAPTNVLAIATTNATAKTNVAGANPSAVPAPTNKLASASTNLTSATNAVVVESTNIISATNRVVGTGTNGPVATNRVLAASPNLMGGTNRIGSSSTNGTATNLASVANSNPLPPGRHGGGMPFGGPPGMPGMGGPGPALPKDVQARVDKIVDSEVFAPVIRPMPMQLFGIAGNTVLLRTDSGQSGLVKEGDSLGDVKVVRIGTNRVLVEQNGSLKELMIFDGYGGESLMPKTNTISK